MVFTLVIWVFGALSLILATLFYIFFLWHYIPNADGGLLGYCERKVSKRLSKIVSVKVNKAIAKEEERRLRADAKALKKGEKPAPGRQATLPVFLDSKSSDDKLPQMPVLNRNDTMTTLPLYSSRPGTPSDQPQMPAFELDELGRKRPFPNRTVTDDSTASYASNAPLIGNASDMGYGRSGSPAPSVPSLPPLDTNRYPGPQRTMTGNTNNSQFRGSPGPPRMPSAMGDRGYTQSPVSYNDGRGPLGPPRMPSAMADRAYSESPVSYTDGRGTPSSQTSVNTFGRPMPQAVADLRSNTPSGPPPSMGRRTPFDPYNGSNPSPAPPSDYGRNSPAPGRSSPAPGRNSPAPPPGAYQPFNPNLRSASAAPTSNPNNPNQAPAPYRNMTDPDYFGRQAPARLASPAPYNGGSPGFGNMNLNGGLDSPGYRRS